MTVLGPALTDESVLSSLGLVPALCLKGIGLSILKYLRRIYN